MAKNKKLTHIDVGITKQMSYVTGQKPIVLRLCGATNGDYIHDSDVAIRANGGYPAGCTCGDCRAIARLMAQNDWSPDKASEVHNANN